jgi:hypothetical protein
MICQSRRDGCVEMARFSRALPYPLTLERVPAGGQAHQSARRASAFRHSCQSIAPFRWTKQFGGGRGQCTRKMESPRQDLVNRGAGVRESRPHARKWNGSPCAQRHSLGPFNDEPVSSRHPPVPVGSPACRPLSHYTCGLSTTVSSRSGARQSAGASLPLPLMVHRPLGAIQPWRRTPYRIRCPSVPWLIRSALPRQD